MVNHERTEGFELGPERGIIDRGGMERPGARPDHRCPEHKRKHNRHRPPHAAPFDPPMPSRPLKMHSRSSGPAMTISFALK